MKENDRQNIRQLINRLSRNAATEDLIGFVAAQDGMLRTCRSLLIDIQEESTVREWFEAQCQQKKIDPGRVTHEIERLLKIFTFGDTKDNALYSILELEPHASIQEVKQAFRRLSRKYHPDSSESKSADDGSKFITLCQAYKAILARKECTRAQQRNNNGTHNGSPSTHPWLYHNHASSSASQKKKNILLISILAAILCVVSLVAPFIYRKQIMLSRYETQQQQTEQTLEHGSPLQNTGAHHQPSQQQLPLADHDTGQNREASAQTPSSQSHLTPVANQDIPAMPLNKIGQAAEVTQGAMLEQQSQREVASVSHRTSIDPDSPAIKRISDQHPALQDNKGDESRRDQAGTTSGIDLKAVVTNPHPDTSGQQGDESRVYQARTAPGFHINSPNELTDTPDRAVLQGGEQQKHATSPLVSEEDVRVSPHQTKKAIVRRDLHKYTARKLNPVTRSPGRKKVRQNHGQPVARIHTSGRTQQQKIAQTSHKSATGNRQLKDTPQRSKELLRLRLLSFLKKYTTSYEHKNFTDFAAFFTEDAVENGAPFIKRRSDYQKLFNDVNAISFSIIPVSWSKEANLVQLHGRFYVQLAYKDGRDIRLNGKISLFLKDKSDGFKVKELSYWFDR